MSTITLRSAKGSPLTNTEVDNNFNNLNTDKYQSGDNASFGNLTISGNLTPSLSATVTAAGTDQGGATALSATNSVVTSVSTGQGVKLPTATAGLVNTVVNATSTALNVYPNSSDQINGAGSAIVVGPYKTATFIAKDGTDWYTDTAMVIYDESGNRLN